MRGILPHQIPDYLALTGDDADGIPGIPGFGAKTAAALLTAFGSLDAIPDAPDTWPAAIRGRERLAPVLARSREDARLFKRLATLVTDADLGATWDDLKLGKVSSRELDAFATTVSSTSLSERARTVDGARGLR
jgi:5'-3' exonuclease